MPNSTKIICLTGHRQVTEFSLEDALRHAQYEHETVWVHLSVDDFAAAQALLLDQFKFHPVAVTDALSDDERPELHEFNDHLFMVVPTLGPSTDGSHQITEVGIFLRSNLIVTVTREPIRAIEELIDRWTNRGSVRDARPGAAIEAILESLVSEFFPYLDQIEDELDDLSDQVFEGESQVLRSILRIKNLLLRARRVLVPFRDVSSSLLRRDMEFIEDDLRPSFHNLYDTALRLSEMIDLNRDTLTSLLDVHLSSVSNNLNQVMKKMTVISTILMSAALVAGIYGMNFQHMPELTWAMGYPFAILIMVGSGIAILGLFRWKKWV